MESQILDFSKSSYIKVNGSFLSVVKDNFPNGRINDTLSSALNVVLHSAVISNYTGKEIENKYKRVRLTDRTIDVALSEEAVRELFSINRGESTVDQIVRKKRRPSKKEMDSYWTNLKSLIAIQVISETDHSEKVSNLFIEIIRNKDSSSEAYPYELVLNRRLIDYVSPRDGDFSNGYTKIGSIPSFLMPKRAVYMYYFISMYQALIITRKWNQSRAYDGHNFNAVIKLLGVDNYVRPNGSLEAIRELAEQVHNTTGVKIAVDPVIENKEIKRLDFYKEVTT